MGLDIYFRRDIANVLRSLASAVEGPEEERTGHNQSWHDGFKAALVAIGLAFGLHEMISQERKGPVWIEIEGEQ